MEKNFINELHIKFLEYIISRDESFGYVQTKDFLLENLEDGIDLRGRKKMGDLLRFMASDGYIERDLYSEVGINYPVMDGKIIERKNILSTVKLKPKGLELVNSYKSDKRRNEYSKWAIYISILAVFIALIGYIFPRDKDFTRLENELDSIKYKIQINEKITHQTKQVKIDTTLPKKQ